MGQKVNPIGFRLAVNCNWQSKWFVRKSFKENLEQDMNIRKAITGMFPNVSISRIIIERFSQHVRVIIFTFKPGMFVGRKGADIALLNTTLAKLVSNMKVSIKVSELKNPEIDAATIADLIAQQLSSRSTFPYRKVLKRAMSSAMLSGAKGIKILCSGRIAGAEIARSELCKLGSVPLHTIRANIDYASRPSHTTYGVIGVKVWVFKGMSTGDDSIEPEVKRRPSTQTSRNWRDRKRQI